MGAVDVVLSLRTLSIIVLLFVPLACKKKPVAPRALTYSFRFERDTTRPGAIAPTRDSTLIFDERAVAPIAAYPISIDASFTVDPAIYVSDSTHRLSLRMPSACGPIDVPLKLQNAMDRAGEERLRERASGEITVKLVEASPTTIPVMDLVIDNRDNPLPTIVEVASTKIDTAARSSKTVFITTGTCEEARRIKVDGRILDLVVGGSDENTTLVDVGGGHCYEWRRVHYAPNERKAWNPPPPESRVYRSPKARKRGPRLLQVRAAEHLFSPPPPTLSSKTTYDPHATSELLGIPRP